jgi:hypothetical protein
MNHPITPLASGQVNHDQISVELSNLTTCQPQSESSGQTRQPLLIRNVSPTPQPRSRNSLREHTSCWPQSGRSGDCNHAGRRRGRFRTVSAAAPPVMYLAVETFLGDM